MDKEEHDQIGLDIKNGFIYSNFKPRKCRSCGKAGLKKVVTAYEGAYACEIKAVCECGVVAGYWSYGDWQI